MKISLKTAKIIRVDELTSDRIKLSRARRSLKSSMAKEAVDRLDMILMLTRAELKSRHKE